jgi:hypothetical protein
MKLGLFNFDADVVSLMKDEYDNQYRAYWSNVKILEK